MNNRRTLRPGENVTLPTERPTLTLLLGLRVTQSEFRQSEGTSHGGQQRARLSHKQGEAGPPLQQRGRPERQEGRQTKL